MNRFISQKGMTLIELLIAIALAGIVTTGIVSAFSSQSKTYVEQEQIAGMQQSLRAGFDLLSREVRMASFNPTKATGVGWVTAASDSIVFSMDLNGNGVVAGEADEYISYALFLHDGVSSLGRKNTSTALNYSAISENITALGFAYAFDANEDGQLDEDAGQTIWAVPGATNWLDLDVDDDGQITSSDDTNNDGTISGEDSGIAVNLGDIRAVRIWVLANTEHPSRDYSENRSFVVGNQVVTPGDKNRYRLLTSVEICRNAGLSP